MNKNAMKIIGGAAGLLGAALLAGCGSGGHGPELSTVNTGTAPHVYTQIDRLSRPAINEVFATVANNRHAVNDQDNPTDDKNQLANDIQSFMTGTAGRSPAITNVVVSVIVPDMMKADLSQQGVPAAYLGVETGGATGSKFGGRDLHDDVIKTSLGIIFGNTIPTLGLAPDDGKEIPTLTDDHVPYDKHVTDTFPYVGAPN